MSEYIEHDPAGVSIGIVRQQKVSLAQPPNRLRLEKGTFLNRVDVVYETYGSLDPDGSNAVLILHALTGGAHAAGIYSASDTKPGWWDIMIGPGKGIDTDRYFVICTSILGSCMGTTGPPSIDPETGTPFGLRFPLITIGDMVTVQKILLDHLGIKRLLAVVGGSIGGMQVLEWTVRYPDFIATAIPIATTAKHSALAIAFNEVARQSIMADPNWNGGDYYGKARPDTGLAVARMIGHITYLSDSAMRQKFGRRLQDKEDFSFNFDADFQVESYLRYQGTKFVERFDANAFLYVTKAADYFDLGLQHGGGSLVQALAGTQSRFLVISFTSDWLYPPYQSKQLVKALKKNNRDVSYCEIEADWGHDAFLLKNPRMDCMVRSFLASSHEMVKKNAL